jgi:hypothetical protein
MRDDSVASAALDALEAGDAPDIGVEPLADLASWFTTSVAPAVSRVALVPDEDGGYGRGGAGVLAHLASHVLSTFAFRRQGLVQGDDVLSVLARAEYYLNEKDLDSATRELNQLRGTAKMLVKDWLEAARRRLEVQQALEVTSHTFSIYFIRILTMTGCRSCTPRPPLHHYLSRKNIRHTFRISTLFVLLRISASRISYRPLFYTRQNDVKHIVPPKNQNFLR